MTTPAVIWDVDGTLVDTADQHFRAWTRLAAEVGQTVHPDLGLSGTRGSFAAVVTGDDVARGKPDPAVFLAAARLRADPQTAVAGRTNRFRL